MPDAYAGLVATVDRLLARFGKDCELVHVTPGGYNPATGTVEPGGEVSYAARAIESGYTLIAGRCVPCHGRDYRALPPGRELPAVVRALEAAIFHTTERQARTAVRAAVYKRLHLAFGIAPQHQRLLQQLYGQWRSNHLGRLGHGVPQSTFSHGEIFFLQ